MAGAAVAMRVPVHPHARGERPVQMASESSNLGSSPRPWGTHEQENEKNGGYRFIPTPVGNAGGITPPVGDRPVHPHARGERPLPRRIRGISYGSSPRPWGTPAGWSSQRCGFRFIPTPVGNACRWRSRPGRHPVHPHARGERRRSYHHPRPTRRFIPTPVGNAKASAPAFGAATVHPHARGERLGVGAVEQAAGGSSPRPWGTRGPSSRGRARRRFIPTPVGNASAPSRQRMRGPVHPHARGERRAQPGRGRHRARFIPTAVGNARMWFAAGASNTVQPPARGERICLYFFEA